MGRTKLTIKDWKKRALSAEKRIEEQKTYFETICNNRMEEIRIKDKKLEQSKKEFGHLFEQLVFVENELQEANSENSDYDDVILSLGKTIRELKSALKRRNINDSLNRNFQSLEQYNIIRPEVEAGSMLKKEN